MVLEAAIRDAVGKLDPAFGYADSFDEAANRYVGLAWAKSPPEIFPSSAVLVRSEVAAAQASPPQAPPTSDATPHNSATPVTAAQTDETGIGASTGFPAKPRRFFGSVELDMVRPVKAFDAVLNAVVMELQRTTGAKVKITVEIEAEAEAGFEEGDIGVVRDNARQLKFKADSTGFE